MGIGPPQKMRPKKRSGLGASSGLLGILNSLRRGKARRAVAPTSDLFRVDLGPVKERMPNGHAERMSFTTSERISLGKPARRATAQPIGRAAERDFDWKSVQAPDRWRDEPPPDDDRYDHNGYEAEEPARGFETRQFEARQFEARHQAPPHQAPPHQAPPRPAAPRRATHELSDVIPETGSLTVQGVQKSFGSRMVVRGVSLSLRRGE